MRRGKKSMEGWKPAQFIKHVTTSGSSDFFDAEHSA